MEQLISFEGTLELLAEPFVQNALIACAVLGVVAGLLAPLVVSRGMAFAVHGTAELAFTGGAAALLVGLEVGLGSVLGAVVAATIFGVLGLRRGEQDSVIGVVMAFGLGLGVLFLSLYRGRGANKFGLLTGQIVTVDDPGLIWLASVSAVVLVALVVLWRPLMFASVDPEIAAARGVPVRALSPIFMVILGLTVAMSVKVIGALLVMALLVTPAAAAMRVTASLVWVPVLSVVFAVVSMLGGIMLALGSSLPISPYITTISFAIYVVCRLAGRSRTGPPRGQPRRSTPEPGNPISNSGDPARRHGDPATQPGHQAPQPGAPNKTARAQA